MSGADARTPGDDAGWDSPLQLTSLPKGACKPAACDDIRAQLGGWKANWAKHWGYPFVFGFTVLSSFETQEVADTGVMPMPADGDKQLGGHAVCCVGYDDDKQCFVVRNSWGSSWGDGGYFYMPYKYMTDSGLASDFWTIRWVE